MSQNLQQLKAEKNEGITFVLNLIFPGAGFIYLGEEFTNQGIGYIIGNLIGMVLTAATGLFAIFWIPFAFFVLIYGFTATKQYNEKIKKENKITSEKFAEQDKTEQEHKEKEAKKIRCEDFIENMEKTYKLFKNELLSEDEFKSRKEKLITQINLNKIAEKPEDFLSSIITLKEKSILTQEELQKIKEYVL